MSSTRSVRHGALALALGCTAAAALAATAAMPPMELDGNAEAGKKVAMDRAKGNCIACHLIPGGDSPGAIGPALVAMQTRYPSKEALAAQIWDPTVQNPEAVMPPFGRHEILSNKDFADVVEFVWSL
jgi:sulfur-oxidizing protein SoxX